MLKTVRTMLIVLLNFIGCVVVVFVGAAICREGYSFAYDTVGNTMAEIPPGREVLVTVAEDESLFRTAKDLQDKQVIRGRYSFWLRLKLEEKEENSVMPGVYWLNSSMTYEEIIRELYPEK